MIKLQDFITKWNNVPCEMEDPSNPDQCMEVVLTIK